MREAWASAWTRTDRTASSFWAGTATDSKRTARSVTRATGARCPVPQISVDRLGRAILIDGDDADAKGDERGAKNGHIPKG